MSVDEWANGLNMNTPLGDISDGWGWRHGVGGLNRVVDEETGNVEDRSPRDPPVRFSSLPFGLSFSLNTDWFQPTREGNYSVGACYLVLNNLPRHLRFLRENICLVLVMPGPNEPNDYALDQMLEPLIEELLELKQGVIINVREGVQPPVYRDRKIYAELSQHIADLIARIKMGGGAGVRSELNFCLYCRARLSSLSVPAGYIRQSLLYRDPGEDLNNAYFWRSLETSQERRAFFEFTGNRFTALHRLPGFHTSTCSPPDAMHLLYLGGMNWILIRTLFQPGMLTKRLPTDVDPVALFNRCLDQMWLPKNFGRLPPKASRIPSHRNLTNWDFQLGQTNTRIKADQWKLATRVVFLPLFMAFRSGDVIPNECVPRGNISTKGAKNQASGAKALHRERKKHFAAIGQPRNCPQLEDCFPSRNLQFHYKQVLRYCVATGTLDKRTVSPEEIQFGTQLLETMCIEYAENNIPEPPNFHIMMHLEDAMLKYGSLYNSHVWGLERANGVLSSLNHNGRGNGMLEGTLMRGWWGIANLQNLIKMFYSLPNRTLDDNEVIENLLSALRGGPEHALQRGTLAAYIAQTKTAYTRLHGIQEPVRLSKQSRVIDLRKEEYEGIYELFVDFCQRKWPHAGIFGNGMAPDRIYLPPNGLIRAFSYVEYNSTRYGSFHHTSGRGYSYGYLGQERNAARIEHILSVDFPGHPELRTECIFFRQFQLPEVEPAFPWSHW
ncbi:LPS-assembly protein [Rhizoctonia solani AG-1 IB]|uniref:LPS-assembly protein n=1 Tax=Thanatephorus cucumeris (strain AG1-IB / isolate 7/3/14) TaxID=1108050 RepID=A0A0B7FDR0_THACB|nr:LPS-assembly protein [Rhizoctonia solani AG-1 IB]